VNNGGCRQNKVSAAVHLSPGALRKRGYVARKARRLTIAYAQLYPNEIAALRALDYLRPDEAPDAAGLGLARKTSVPNPTQPYQECPYQDNRTKNTYHLCYHHSPDRAGGAACTVLPRAYMHCV
jgi:hypothetical protein